MPSCGEFDYYFKMIASRLLFFEQKLFLRKMRPFRSNVQGSGRQAPHADEPSKYQSPSAYAMDYSALADGDFAPSPAAYSAPSRSTNNAPKTTFLRRGSGVGGGSSGSTTTTSVKRSSAAQSSRAGVPTGSSSSHIPRATAPPTHTNQAPVSYGRVPDYASLDESMASMSISSPNHPPSSSRPTPSSRYTPAHPTHGAPTATRAPLYAAQDSRLPPASRPRALPPSTSTSSTSTSSTTARATAVSRPRLAPTASSRPQHALPRSPATSGASWGTHPTSTVPCAPAHPRPVFCLSVHAGLNTIVSGSADHGLRVFNARTGRLERELYSKDSGHKEWVTACSVLPSGAVLSGGMDFTGCLWPRASTRCAFVGPHEGPVTRIAGDDAGTVLTSSMDGTLALWAADTAMASKAGPGRVAQRLGTYTGHGGAVTTFAWTGDAVVSADRGGGMHVWDVERCEAIRTLPGHKSIVHALSFLCDAEDNAEYWATALGVPQEPSTGLHDGHAGYVPRAASNLVVSGGADGYFKVYDLRQDGHVSSRKISGGQGPGTVNDIAVWGWGVSRAARGGERGDHSGHRADLVEAEAAAMRAAASQGVQAWHGSYGARSTRGVGDYLIAAGTGEGRVALIDPRMSFRTVASLAGHKTPVMAVRVSPDGRYVLSTSSLGELMCHDAHTSEAIQPNEDATKIPSVNARWGMVVSQGPNNEEARIVVGSGSGGRAVGCLEVYGNSAVCAGDDGTPLILHFDDSHGQWVN